jgi:Bacterial cellulose synthase subunit.
MKHYIQGFLCAAAALTCLVSASSAASIKPSAPQADSNIATTTAGQDSTNLSFDAVSTPSVPAPSCSVTDTFSQLGQSKDMILLGVRNHEQIDFGVRRDRVVTDAQLNLSYTPSPSLIPVLSQLRIYLNDTLMQVLTIDKQDLGRTVNRTVSLDPHLISDYNRIRIDFIGHYTNICEDPANSTLWLDIASNSSITLHEQALAQTNDLAWFPSPFFDPHSNRTLVLPFIFGATPKTTEVQAASILASYFGSLAEWRGATFPVYFGRLPPESTNHLPRNSVVLATNSTMPAFLNQPTRFPPVSGPTVQLIDNPESPYIKILLVRGRNDEDLLTAVRALAAGGKLFRGSSVTVRHVKKILRGCPMMPPTGCPPTDRFDSAN